MRHFTSPGAAAMTVSSDTISEMAQLARLRVSEAELADLTERCNAILELFEQLQAAPVQGLEPMANPLDASQPLRPDRVTEHDRRALLQAAAPAVDNGLYLVPRVLE